MKNILLTPFNSPKLKLKNRFVMAPMTRSMSPNNTPGTKSVEYYERRAEGEVGLIITEGVSINHPAAPGYPNVPTINSATMNDWKKVTTAVHNKGGKIAIQLWHVGCNRDNNFDPENKIESVSPSGIYYLENPKKNHTPRALTTEEVEELIAAYAEGAQLAKQSGFDAIEIHGAHGYLIDQFFWDVTNTRTDRFGGETLKDRTRFAVEIIKACRKEVGPDYPIIFRFSNWKLGSYENHLFKNADDLQSFLIPLVEAGVDIFHASTRNFNKSEFENSTLNLAGWTKKLTNIPTISVGSVGLSEDFIKAFQGSEGGDNITELKERMNNEEFDLIAVGRALIGDPQFVHKVQSGDFKSIKPYTKECLAQLY